MKKTDGLYQCKKYNKNVVKFAKSNNFEKLAKDLLKNILLN